jgi:hypothetical protein
MMLEKNDLKTGKRDSSKREKITRGNLHNGGKLRLKWILAHSVIEDNKVGDQEAKNATIFKVNK